MLTPSVRAQAVRSSAPASNRCAAPVTRRTIGRLAQYLTLMATLTIRPRSTSDALPYDGPSCPIWRKTGSLLKALKSSNAGSTI